MLELQKSANAAQAPLITKALEKETDPEIKTFLQMVAATANLQSHNLCSRIFRIFSPELLTGISRLKDGPAFSLAIAIVRVWLECFRESNAA